MDFLLMDFQFMDFQLIDYIVYRLQLLMDFQFMDFQFMEYLLMKVIVDRVHVDGFDWVFSTKPFSRQKRVLVELQLGHVIIGMTPATPSMHENHAFDHKKIVNIVWKAHLFRHARQKERQKSWMNV